MPTEIIRADELLLHAVVSGRTERVAEMLTLGRAAVNAACQFKQTPLHHAAANDHAEICKLLLECGARVDARAIDGCTPLHFAARDSCPLAVAELLAAGADAASRNSSGLRPIQLLWDDEEDADIVRMLVAAGGGYPVAEPKTAPRKPPLPPNAPFARAGLAIATASSAASVAVKPLQAEPARVDAQTGKVERLVEATVVVRQGPGTGNAPAAPSVDAVCAGLRCMAVGTDTDFPWEEEDAAAAGEVTVVFDAPAPKKLATCSGGTQTLSM
mmetsp:Transcript_31900/g.81675  ORF Transcript_31900/g.81675 Transcript_31900/m.81675 type:complete len:271 (-) Transcript_31900:688-1500(-)|eukprot:jgi/Tetstr1/446120/TSEL_033720.t1